MLRHRPRRRLLPRKAGREPGHGGEERRSGKSGVHRCVSTPTPGPDAGTQTQALPVGHAPRNRCLVSSLSRSSESDERTRRTPAARSGRCPCPPHAGQPTAAGEAGPGHRDLLAAAKDDRQARRRGRPDVALRAPSSGRQGDGSGSAGRAPPEPGHPAPSQAQGPGGTVSQPGAPTDRSARGRSRTTRRRQCPGPSRVPCPR